MKPCSHQHEASGQGRAERGSAWDGGSLLRATPVVVGLMAVVALVVAGCQDEVRRYETLSFFFDDVPPPEGYDLPVKPEPLIGPWGVEVDPESELGREMLARREAQPGIEAVSEPDRPVFYHAPYKSRNCFGCHDQEKGYQPPEAGADLCIKCHESYMQFEPGDRIHGPVVVGDCGWCHSSHKSEYKGLVRDSQPALCLSCHEQSILTYDEYHEGMEDPRCTDCHDPHASGNRMLLADSRTYQRRDTTLELLPSPHAGWPKDLCRSCHVPELSNQLTQDVDSTCLTCHGEFDPPGPEDPNLHEAVKQGKCTTCHMPHRSPLAKLLRADAEQKCYQCHAPEELQTGNHPDAERVDCLLCHSGHRSERPHLLKPGIPIAPRPVESGGAR